MAGRLLEGKKPYLFLVMYFLDVSAFIASLSLPIVITGADPAFLDFYTRLTIFSLLILIVNYSAFGLYEDRRNLFDDSLVLNILYSLLITFAIIFTFCLTFNVGFVILPLAFGFLVAAALTIALRMLLFRAVFYLRGHGYDQKRVVFFGKGNEDLVARVKDSPHLGYRVVGSCTKLDDLERLIPKTDIVFVLFEKIEDSLLSVILEHPRINWKIIPSASNLVMSPVSFDEFKDYPVINLSSEGQSSSYARMKRFVDIILSGVALVMLSPLFLVIAAMIKATSKGPVFYLQERIGMGGRPFMLFKFRTMVQGADEMKPKLRNEVKGLFKMKRDPRVTWFGNLLRRSCIDELPQLINIFKGDMSLVGPRPHLKIEMGHFTGWRKARFQVKPGLTGMWQVNGRHELNFDKAVLYDIYYIRHMSFFLDIAIIMKTIPAILFSKGRY